MRFVFVCLLALLGACHSAPRVEARNFELNLAENWIDTEVRGEGVWSFISKEPLASLVISEHLVSVREGQIYAVAAGVVRERKKLERQVRGGRTIHFLDDSVRMDEDETSAEISYLGRIEGSDEYIHYIGYVSRFRIHGFWVSVETSDPQAATAVLATVLKGLKSKPF